jgi:alkylation response protein AidB-like acyl-CoA dehydrogenase
MQLSQEQTMIRDTVRRAAQARIAPFAEKVDRDDRWIPDYMAVIRELGLLGMAIPADAGGQQSDLVSQCLVMEELFGASAAAGLMVSATWACANTIARRPSAAARPFLERIVRDGCLGSYCLSEPDAGSDAANVQTFAKRDGDHYVINGKKCWITNGGDAEIYVVLATVRPGSRAKGTAAFVMDGQTPGLSATRFEDKMGTRGARLAEITLDNVRVPAAQRIGEEGEGLRIVMESQNVSRLYMAAACVGIAQAALTRSIAYAKERVQFGKPIAEFQMVQGLLADMAVHTEAARTVTYDTAQMIDGSPTMGGGAGDGHIRKMAAIAKVLTSDAAVKVASDAIQVHGGYGYMRTGPVERFLRDAKIFQIFAGTNQIQHLAIAKELLAE